MEKTDLKNHSDQALPVVNLEEAPSIRFESVFKSFRGGRDQVLKGLNVEFPAGKLTYILGSSGAGKSVMLKHVLGLHRPDTGRVLVGRHCVSEMNSKQLSSVLLQFGMLFQNSALFDDMTVFENVAFPLREHTVMSEDQIYQAVSQSLTILGMKEAGFDKFPNELSGGMRKRVGLARAIVREPKVILYDEPTTGLDPVTRTTVDDLIATIKSRLKVTSLVISHDIPSALHLADYITFLHQGQSVFWGTPSEFRQAKHEAILQFLDAEERTLRALQGGRA